MHSLLRFTNTEQNKEFIIETKRFNQNEYQFVFQHDINGRNKTVVNEYLRYLDDKSKKSSYCKLFSEKQLFKTFYKLEGWEVSESEPIKTLKEHFFKKRS